MTRIGIAESDVEEAALTWLEQVGFAVGAGPDLGPDGITPERTSYGDVVLEGRLSDAIARLNPQIPAEAREEALRRILQAEKPSLVEENRRIHRLIVDGVPVEFPRDDGTIGGDTVRLVDFSDHANNDWLALNQVTVIEDRVNRRPDIVVYLNGLPVVVIELKHPSDENATLDGAFNQLQTYKNGIPSLFRTNALLVISDGLNARVGSLTANFERFMPWRTVDGSEIEPKGSPELETLLKGVCTPRRLLDLVQDFTVFGQVETKDKQLETVKIVAGYHQYHAVLQAVQSTLRATAEEGDRKIGVVWHTQGSGKSLLMAFYAGQVIRHSSMENPTLVILTDRNDLDDQLFGTFSMCKALLRQTPQQAGSREELRKLLDRPSGGVIFTTIQKFSPEEQSSDHPVLTERRNVIVIADEAHRSQYGFKAKLDRKTAGVSYGFAKYLRDAIPNASFIGFTGTPIEASDVNTPAVFGTYIDVYDISRAVEDGATVPIYYESRLARIELDEDEKPNIDAEVEALTEGDAETEQERLKRKWASVEAVVGSEKRLALVAQDLVEHFERRTESMPGKGMIVCMSRRICVELYQQITKLRPEWHSAEDEKGAIKVVMTGSASDPETWQPHIGKRPKARRDMLAKRAKDPNDDLQLVIVRDMWLTGFDAPSMHTMYVDKPMKGHGLMQAIARVNRVFKDKPGGLVVDYIGIAQNMKNALRDYSEPDQDITGIDKATAVAVMLEKYDIVRAMFAPDSKGGFDYRPALDTEATAAERLSIMAGAIDWVLSFQQEEAAKATSEDDKKRAHRRYADAVTALAKAFALAAASDEASAIRDEVGFFQAIRSALAKSTDGGGKSKADRELAIQQLVSRAVVSTEIVDIMQAAGIQSPDISILSDDFLAEVRDMDKKNLALEALRKLINGEVRSQGARNVTQAKAFSERLQAAISRYHANAVSTVQVLEELIQLAKDIHAARQRGEETGLSDEEIAFYDALSENDSARDILGEPQLRLIAHELVEQIRKNISVDWTRMETARARMRVLVKRILRKYGYPPDLQDAAVQTVLQQAEALSSALS